MNTSKSRSEIVVSLYQSGSSFRDIVRKLGKISPNTIRRMLQDADVKIRPMIHVSKRTCDESYFDIIDTEDKAYWLGFIMADGCIRTNSHSLTVNLSTVDIGHLEKLRTCLRSDQPFYHQKDIKSTCGLTCLNICNKKLTDALSSKGIIAHNKSIFKVENSLRRHFWRGVVDGNGTIGFCYNKSRFCRSPQIRISLVGNTETIDRFYEFCLEHIKTKAVPHRNITGRKLDEFRIGSRKALTIGSLLYDNSTMFLDRKKRRFNRIRRIYLDYRK